MCSYRPRRGYAERPNRPGSFRLVTGAQPTRWRSLVGARVVAQWRCGGGTGSGRESSLGSNGAASVDDGGDVDIARRASERTPCGASQPWQPSHTHQVGVACTGLFFWILNRRSRRGLSLSASGTSPTRSERSETMVGRGRPTQCRSFRARASSARQTALHDDRRQSLKSTRTCFSLSTEQRKTWLVGEKNDERAERAHCHPSLL
jgi:hypothetical protein